MSTELEASSAESLLADLINKLDAQLKYVMIDDFDAVDLISSQIAPMADRIKSEKLLDDPRYALQRSQIDSLTRRACVALAAKRQHLARELEKIRRGLKITAMSSTRLK